MPNGIMMNILGPSSNEPSRQIESIQFLRFIAALIVVIYHASLAMDVYGLNDKSYNYFANIFSIGESGVHIFFVISGFIMVYTTVNSPRNHQTVFLFLYRRAARIYPIYWICCLFYLVIHIYVLEPHNLDIIKLVKALLLWPGYSAGIIGPGWTLSYEIYFYVCFGLTLFFSPVPALIALTIAMSVAILSGIALGSSRIEMQVLTNPLLVEFLAGAWIAMFCLSRHQISTKVTDLLIGAALILFAVPVWFDLGIPSVLRMGLPSALIILGLVQRERQGRLPNFVRDWSRLGDQSYSLYLLHNLVLDLVFITLVSLGATASFGWLWAFAGIIASLFVSRYIHLWLEAPVHRKLAHLGTKRMSISGSENVLQPEKAKCKLQI